MKPTSTTIKTILAAAVLALGGGSTVHALSRNYTVSDLTSGRWLPSESLYRSLAVPMTGATYGYYYGLADPDLLYEVNTYGVNFEQQSSNVILIKGMFGGLLDLPFTLSGNTLKLNTNATAGGDPVYVVNYPASRPDIKKIILSPVEKYQANDYVFLHKYVSTGWTSDALVEVSGTQNSEGLYDLSISFNNKPVELQISYTDGSTDKIYVDTYQFDLFKPTSAVTDIEVKGGVQTPRSYKGEFEYQPGSTFQLSNWGGRYAGLKPSLQRALMGNGTNNEPVYAQYYYSDIAYMTGSYDLTQGTALLNTENYTLELSADGNYGDSRVNKTVKLYKVMEQTSSGSWKNGVEGTVRALGDHSLHKGATRWITNGGDCTTWTRLEFSFNDWASVFQGNSADDKVGVVKQTRIVPDAEVEVTLGVDVLNDIKVSHANSSDHFLTATVPFVVTANEHFTTSYDVYVLQGRYTHHSQVDMKKAMHIGNVPYSASAGGQYSVTGTFVPEINVNPGELFKDDFTFFVRANYGREASARSVSLEPTHHDLTPVNFSVITGVEGIDSSSDISVEITPGGVQVSAPSSIAVQICNMAGMTVATGVSNSEIALDGSGVFIVRAGGRVFKIVK